VIEDFLQDGYTVSLNLPFAGALVPATFFRRDSNLAALMIEVNRALYMGERIGANSNRFVETGLPSRKC
jgi:N-formylglutamate amidohydrolase